MIGRWLRAADPLAREPELSRVEVAAMRRAVIAAADQQRAAAPPWPSALVVATTIAATLVAGVAIGRSVSTAPNGNPLDPAVAVEETGGGQQLQFATRGGTRVIWIFDSEFQP